ncbi:hypothetical protein B9Z55_007638 [Caenorhabditis nigoni]|nr:hypothetical protein B9Z55_007638 [Caenorhabditis nigoni]
MQEFVDIDERGYFFLEQETFIRVSIVIQSTYFEITVNDYWTIIYEFRMSSERIANLRIKGALVTELVNMLPPQAEKRDLPQGRGGGPKRRPVVQF